MIKECCRESAANRGILAEVMGMDLTLLVVNAPDMQMVTLELDPNTTIAEVKRLTLEATDLDSDQGGLYELRFDGRELDDTATIAGIGLADGAELDLNPR